MDEVLTAPVADAAPAAVESAPAPQSDEQILGIEEVGSTPEPVLETEQAPQPDAAVKTEPEITADVTGDGRQIPQKWRELANSDPEFKTLFFTAKTNADKIAQMEPQFNDFKTKVEAVQKADEAYLSGDPTAIAGELHNFIGDKPQAVLPMIQAGEQLLKQLLPQEYAKFTAERFTEGLKGNNFGPVFQVLRNALQAGEGGQAVLKEQIEKILGWAEKNGFPTTEEGKLAAKASELEARERSWQEQEQRTYSSTVDTFRNNVNKQVEDAFSGEVKTAVTKLLEKSAFPDGARQRIAADVRTKLYEKLAQNREVLDQVNKAIWPNGQKDAQGKEVRGRWDASSMKVAIDAPVGFAKTILNNVIKEVVDQYTKDFIASTDASQKKFAAAAGKSEIAGGSSAPRGKKPLTSKDTKGLTDEQILDL